MEQTISSCQILKFPATLLGLLLFLQPFNLQAQWDRNLEFNIVHHGDVKGNVQLFVRSEGNIRHIKAESLIQTKFLFLITVKTIEETIYKGGMLIFARFYQNINDDEKSDRGIISKNGSYQFSGNKISGRLPTLPVENTVLSLYYNEPIISMKSFLMIFKNICRSVKQPLANTVSICPMALAIFTSISKAGWCA